MKAVSLVIFLSAVVLRVSAQDPCPSREPSATGCEKPCQADATCRKPGKECVCDGRCGLSCLRKGCEVITPPANGNVTIEPSDRAIGSNATFTCSAGYILRGSETLQCLQNKTWSSSTDTTCECIRNDPGGDRCVSRICETDDNCRKNSGRRCVCDGVCGLSCIRTELENYCNTTQLESAHVDIKIDPPSAIFGTTARQTCQQGYIPQGDDDFMERRCLGNRYWSKENLICIPENRCPDPPEVEFAVHDDSQSYYLPGQRVSYECRSGYYPSGSNSIICQEAYTWQIPDLECIPRSCGAPERITNGQRIGTVYTFPSSVTYVCNDGYKLDRYLDTIHCQSNGEWSRSPPGCAKVDCDNPSILDGSITWVNGDVHVECDSGFNIAGDADLTCRGDGVWSPGIPTCYRTSCNIESMPTVTYSALDGSSVEGLLLVDTNDKNNADLVNGIVQENQAVQAKCSGDYDLKVQTLFKCAKGDWETVGRPFCSQRKKGTT